MPYKIKVLTDVCIGAGTCVAEAPNTFEMSDDDIAFVIDPEGDDDDTVLAAAQGCPVDAIVLLDPRTGKQVWPQGG